jgi:hypothetical protein
MGWRPRGGGKRAQRRMGGREVAGGMDSLAPKDGPCEGRGGGAAGGGYGWAEVTRIGMIRTHDEGPGCSVMGKGEASLPFDCNGDGEERMGSRTGEAEVTTMAGL